MNLNLYLIEDDEHKALWLDYFAEALSIGFPHLQITIKNTKKAFQDSGSVEFIESAFSDPDGLLVLDLILPARSRLAAANALIKNHLCDDNGWNQVWRHFGGPQRENTKLASVIAFLACRNGCRVVWNSTQNEIPHFFGFIQNIAGAWPLIYWPPNHLTPQANKRTALDGWNTSFGLHHAVLEEMLESFRQPYFDSATAWTAARARLKDSSFTDNGGESYTGLFSNIHKRGAMHNAGNHEKT